ncbi:MAG: hypothetical protein ACREIC_08525, partial [Limisphaerales bacterium]
TRTGGGCGPRGGGTVFAISLPVQLSIAAYGESLVLSWPTNLVGYTLESTTNLDSAVWTTNSPSPIIVNGQNTVTSAISRGQQFFRLTQ